jgi:hypothetical protein
MFELGDQVEVGIIKEGKFTNDPKRQGSISQGKIVWIGSKFVTVNLGRYKESFELGQVRKI